MIYASACSGIEAATVAWAPLGWHPAWYTETAAFPRAVLAHHHPDVPNLGDLNTAHQHDQFTAQPIDILVGGTPCQSFSVAGLRAGLADPRGNLALVFLGVAARLRPRWVVWENVPGVLSSNEGRDFGAFLGALGKLGYGWAYRVLDAQYFGVPQRRRRVFVVGYLGDWRRAGAVLFERACLRGDSPPRREKGKDVAGTLAARTRGSGGIGTDAEIDGALIPTYLGNAEGGAADVPYLTCAGIEGLTNQSPLIASTLRGGPDGGRSYGKRSGSDQAPMVVHSLRADGFDASEDGTGRGTPLMFDTAQMTSAGNYSVPKRGDPSHPLHTAAPPTIAMLGFVRRITPREAERLQGFPDDYTLIPYRGKPAADGPRYKALGNSFAVPVIRWIGERIRDVETPLTHRPGVVS